MIIASEPTIDLPLENLSFRQKLDLFHHLREELGFEMNPEPPDWHYGILKKREDRIARGEGTWIPIEDAFKSLKASLPPDRMPV